MVFVLWVSSGLYVLHCGCNTLLSFLCLFYFKISDITQKLLWPTKLLFVWYETGRCVTCFGTRQEDEEGSKAVDPVGMVLEDCMGGRTQI